MIHRWNESVREREREQEDFCCYDLDSAHKGRGRGGVHSIPKKQKQAKTQLEGGISNMGSQLVVTPGPPKSWKSCPGEDDKRCESGASEKNISRSLQHDLGLGKVALTIKHPVL